MDECSSLIEYCPGWFLGRRAEASAAVKAAAKRATERATRAAKELRKRA